MFWGLSVPGPGFTTMLHSKQIGTKESLHLLGQSWDWICSGASQSLWFFSLWKSEGEVAQSCPTLCDHIGCSLPGSSIHGVFQARVLGWVAISFSRGSSKPRDQTPVSHIAADSLPCEPPGKPLVYGGFLIHTFD